MKQSSAPTIPRQKVDVATAPALPMLSSVGTRSPSSALVYEMWLRLFRA